MNAQSSTAYVVLSSEHNFRGGKVDDVLFAFKSNISDYCVNSRIKRGVCKTPEFFLYNVRTWGYIKQEGIRSYHLIPMS